MNPSGSETSAVSERLDAARTALRRERRRTADELEALNTFEDHVRSIDPSTAPRNGPGRTVVSGMSTATGGLERVRDAYESTVMSVPHYTEEYDDTYYRSLKEEFAPDIAVALTDGAAFNEQCKRAVLSAVRGSREARESLIEGIDAERESIDDAFETLIPVADELGELSTISFHKRSFGALDAYRSRIEVLEGKCESVSDRRQETVFEQRRTRWLPKEPPDIAQYFYQGLEVDYPVMSSIADLVEAISSLRRRIERAMTFCHA